MLDIKCTSGFIANERFLGSYRLQNEGSLLIVPTFRFNPLLKCTWIPYSDLKFCYKRVLRQVTVVISKKYRSSKNIFSPIRSFRRPLLVTSGSGRMSFAACPGSLRLSATLR